MGWGAEELQQEIAYNGKLCFLSFFVPFSSFSSPSFLISFPFPFFLSYGYLESSAIKLLLTLMVVLEPAVAAFRLLAALGSLSISLAGRLPLASALSKLAPLYFPRAWQCARCPTSTSIPASAVVSQPHLSDFCFLLSTCFSRWIFPSFTVS